MDAPVDLYALPPEEFTAARDAAARQDRALKALRRPTVSAWILNTLVRRDAAALEELLALGGELARAQRDGDAPALRRLGEQRRQVVGEVTQRAVDLVDRPVSDAVRLEVAATLDAAVVDPASAEAVLSGQLVRALAFAGFGGVDLAGAVAGLGKEVESPRGTARRTGHEGLPFSEPRCRRGATLSSGAPEALPPGRRKGSTTAERAEGAQRVVALERAALVAQGALDDAVQEAARAERAVEAQAHTMATASADVETAAATVLARQRALEEAEAEHTTARQRRTEVERTGKELAKAARKAGHAVTAAQEAADRARAALDTARRS